MKNKNKSDQTYQKKIILSLLITCIGFQLIFPRFILGGPFILEKKVKNQLPTMKASITEFNVPNDLKGGGDFSIKLIVPMNHHVYLDKGEGGYFIPVKFDFAHIENNYKISLIKSPEGEYDKEVEAKILRRVGVFKFSIARQSKWNLKNFKPIKINYQMCNDLTNICYRPQSETLSLVENVP